MCINDQRGIVGDRDERRRWERKERLDKCCDQGLRRQMFLTVFSRKKK